MFNKLSDENKQIILVVSVLLLLPLLLLAINYFLPAAVPEPEKKTPTEKTVIVTEAKNNAPGQNKATPQQVAATVRDAIRQGNFSTAYLEVSKAPKDSREYKELNNAIAPEQLKRKTPGVVKEPVASQSAPVRYFDESTPRDRSADAIYLYFVEISGTFWPRFCIQVIAKHDPGITGLQINADGRSISLPPAPLKTEQLPKGVAMLYDMPLDKLTYDIVQTLIKSKKASLIVNGSSGKSTRTISADEIKGFTRILEGFEAVGGNLNYLKVDKPPVARKKPAHAK